MQTQKMNPRPYEFYLRDLDNYLLVESSARGVVIRASRNNCSERRKAFFLREISAEGYIPDRRQAPTALQPPRDVEWIIDESWKTPSPPRLGTSLMVGLLVSATVLWLGLITLVFLNARW
jgi:hypothetical protein